MRKPRPKITPPKGMSNGPCCPFCKSHFSRTTTSKRDGEDFRRERQCQCGQRYTTYEQYAANYDHANPR